MSRRKSSDEEDDEEEEPSWLENAIGWWNARSDGEKDALKFGAALFGKMALDALNERYAPQPPAQPAGGRQQAAPATPPPDEQLRHTDALLLGCSPYPSTETEVKKAYRLKAREVHPDRAGAASTESMKVINAAYERHLARVNPSR